jgi:hypothetical protein
MSSDFVPTAELLQREVHEFFRAVRRSHGDAALLQVAARCLRAVVHDAEPYGEDPGEAWEHLAIEQRWGDLRVASLLGTAVHELRRLRISV